MGKPKSNPYMGAAVRAAKRQQQLQVRAAFGAQAGGVHTVDDPKGLKSVWEATDLQDFLHTAEQNEKDFTAERDTRIVVQGVTHVYQDSKMRPMAQGNVQDVAKWYKLSERLPIPVRPQWNHMMSKESIDEQEREAFLSWRRKIALIEEQEGVLMTPYERNLEVWKQLWRVMERSNIVFIIVDARNPLAFRCKALEKSVEGLKKKFVLLLNKAELLTEAQRKAWAKTFEAEGVTALFFSASAAKAELEGETAKGRTGDGHEAEAGGEEKVAQDLKGEEEDDDDVEASPPVGSSGAPAPPGKKSRRNNKKLKGQPALNLGSQKQAHPFSGRPERPAPTPSAPAPITEEERERTQRVQTLRDMGGVAVAEAWHRKEPWRIYTPDQLVDFILLHRPNNDMKGDPIMAGFVGYPNVGKSSTINVLWRSKKVNVSATPGKTKHFQTLRLPTERRVMLCDCPGLVFPSFATTRDHMICDGILPISQLKDAIAPMTIIATRIPKITFEMLYTINLDWSEDKDNSPTFAHLVANVYARSRGMMTDHDKPNASRAARAILRDYVDGKLVYVWPPPSMEGDFVSTVGGADEGEEEEDAEEEWEEVEEDEEEEEEEDMDHPPMPAMDPRSQAFNEDNANMDDVYQKVLSHRPHRKTKLNPQVAVDDFAPKLNEDGMMVVEVSDDDGIQEMTMAPKVKQTTKRQMRMEQKNALRGRTKGVSQTSVAGYKQTF